MAGFRRVFGSQAGPKALGILVPPGQRTVLVARPRSLPWDLLLIEPGDRGSIISFRDFAQEEAEAAAEAFGRALDDWPAGDSGRVEAQPAPGSPGYCVRVEIGRLCLIACPRLPGQAYRPMVFGSAEEATDAARAIQAVLCPPPGGQQEIYFNSRHFARS